MTEEYDTAAREPPCSLDDVKRVVTDEGDKSASYKMAINSPRSVVMCLLTVGFKKFQRVCTPAETPFDRRLER